MQLVYYWLTPKPKIIGLSLEVNLDVILKSARCGC